MLINLIKLILIVMYFVWVSDKYFHLINNTITKIQNEEYIYLWLFSSEDYSADYAIIAWIDDTFSIVIP